MIVEEAYAKINLSLDVVGKREDGYHLVKMIMQSIDLHDTLELEKTETGIKLYTDSDVLNDEAADGKDNLIVKAARTIMTYAGITSGVSVRLTKRIPIAAGMAGGSSDAAATLRGINRLYGLNLTTDELCDMAVKLGADVPFCIEGGTSLCEGIGEILSRLPTPERTSLVIVKPDIAVSTPVVYKGFDALENPFHPDVEGQLNALKAGDGKRVMELCGNALEQVTVSMHPVITEIEKLLTELGAIKAVMSGSGPTVFAFARKEDVENIVEGVKKVYPGFYVKGHFYG